MLSNTQYCRVPSGTSKYGVTFVKKWFGDLRLCPLYPEKLELAKNKHNFVLNYKILTIKLNITKQIKISNSTQLGYHMQHESGFNLLSQFCCHHFGQAKT